MSVFDTAKKVVVGDVAHDIADTGSPISIGGRASSSAPTAVDVSDRVRAWFDLNGRLVVDVQQGVAHDAVDAGGPVKIGGKASSTLPALVSSGDRVNAYYDQRGRAGVIAYGGYVQVDLTPADPSPTGTDIVDDAGSVIAAGDLTIRDTNAHAFVIPMGVAGYRSLIIYLENDGTAWDHAPTFIVYGCAAQLSVSFRGAILASFTGVVTASNRICIGTSAVGTGGLTGSDPVAGMYYYYPIPAMADGWPYIALYISFASAPSQGEFDDIKIMRMA